MENTSTSTRVFLFLLFLLFSFSGYSQCPISGDSTVCMGDVETYSTTASGPYTYQWSAFGGVVSGTGTSTTVSWGNSISGQVTLVVRDAGNNVICTAVKNVTLSPKPVPAITPSIIVGCGIVKPGDNGSTAPRKDDDGCFNICDSTWVTYTTPNHPGSTYSWSISGLATSTPSVTNSINVLWTSPGTGTVTVTETNAQGCIGTQQVCVKIVARPVANFTSLNIPVGGIITACKDQPIQFDNLSNAGGGTSLISYQWIFGDGETESGPLPGSGDATHAYDSAGTYTVSLIIENECHCKDTFKLTVQVSALPGPDIFCISTVCPGATVTYHTDATCGTYNWSVTNGTIVGSNTDSVVTVTWGSNGPGIITLGVTGCGGFCTTPTSVFVPIIVPNAQISGPAQVCLYDCYRYHISCDIPVDSIVWHLPPGATLSSGDSTNVHEIQVCYNDPTFTSGNITVDYFNRMTGSTDNLSCGGHSTLNVQQRPKLFVSGPAQICDKSLLNVYPSSNGGNILWTITNLAGNITYYNTTLPDVTNISVNWTYGPGSFIVTATGLNGQFCNSPQSMTIKVNALPLPPDSITGPAPVCPGKPYNYLAFATSSGYAILWSVQNGTPVSGAGNTIAVIWNTTGPYILHAMQVDPATGCVSDTLSDTIPSLLPLAAAPVLGDDSACANNTSTHFMNVPGDDFMWSISPSIAGSVTSGQHTSSVGIEWNNFTGTAVVNVIRTVCGQTITSTINIPVSMPPVPVITVPPTACQGAPVAMSSSTPAVSYSWNFGDGTPAGTGANPSHVYAAAGNYIVTLTTTYGGSCSGTATKTATIMINPKPNVTISTPDPNLFCGPVGTVNMYVAGPVAGVTYVWYKAPALFLVGGTSYSTNVLGQYYVIGTNSFGCMDTSNVIPIDSVCDTCSANPSYTLNFIRTRLTCNTDSFSGTFTPGAINPRWNFDDPFSGGNTASGSQATHFFKEPGYYRVTFCVDVPNIAATGYCKICVMKVDTIQYVPDFYDSLYCISGVDSVKIKFLNQTKRLSTLPVPAYSWLVMPGGFTSAASDPTFSLAPGAYSISLTVAGVCVITKTVNVPGFPNAAFTANDSICVLAGIPFSNTSTGVYNTATWAFGDGASSLVVSPTRVYSAAGVYNVMLTVTNAFGCKDSIGGTVRVLPNTLNGTIVPSADISICEGDSILLTVNPSGGYPAYTYLWSTIQNTPSVWAKYTGSYYTDLMDSKSCFFKTAAVNVLANPVPRPEIFGKADMCVNTLQLFTVNYPASGYTIEWRMDTTLVAAGTSQYNTMFFSLGNHVLTVKVTSATGCVGIDSVLIIVHPNPSTSVISSGALCEGNMNLLVGFTPSPGVVNAYWNNGSVNDSLYTSVPGNYAYTVVDSFGCKATTAKNVAPLPDFCGLMTGCYEFCDTVTSLVWHAPSGYASYQWYYNGVAIAGATYDTLHIPLYQAGLYRVKITTAQGCSATSEPIDLSFVHCGSCAWKFETKIECGPVNTLGQQTYTVNMNLFNTMGAGAGYSITSASGTITGLSPAVLAAGSNAVTFTFTDVPPANPLSCFYLSVYNNNQKCDTTYCLRLPPCGGDCKKKVEIKYIDCAGYDASGNPVYNFCTNIGWGGSTGSTLTVTTPTGTFVPNPVSLVNGTQSICFTYTDLPPHSGLAYFYFNFFDPVTGKTCVDSIKREYRVCKDSCELGVYGLCAHCKYIKEGVSTYSIEVTVYNPFSSGTISVLPVAGGTFGTITPNPVGAGMQTFDVLFTDNLPRDTIICFRVAISDGMGSTCYQDVCVYLPECEDDHHHTGLNGLNGSRAHIAVAPNPASSGFKVFYEVPFVDEALSIEILDVSGKSVVSVNISNRTGMQEFNDLDMKPGVYFVNLRTPSGMIGYQRLVIVK